MNWLGLINPEKFLLFTLVLVRTSGLVVTAPIFGTREVPAQVRVLLALALAVLIVPTQWHCSVPEPGTTPMYLVLVGSELLVRMCLGLAVVILLTGLHLAGEMIGYTSGMMLADLYDPSFDNQSPIFSRLMFLVGVAVFVCIGGHRAVIGALLDTFAAIPPGAVGVPQSLPETMVLLVAQSFALAVRAAMPVVASLLLTTLVLGLIARTVPQLNILLLGFGLNSLVALGVLSLTIGAAAWALQDYAEPALEMIQEALLS